MDFDIMAEFDDLIGNDDSDLAAILAKKPEPVKPKKQTPVFKAEAAPDVNVSVLDSLAQPSGGGGGLFGDDDDGADFGGLGLGGGLGEDLLNNLHAVDEDPDDFSEPENNFLDEAENPLLALDTPNLFGDDGWDEPKAKPTSKRAKRKPQILTGDLFGDLPSEEDTADEESESSEPEEPEFLIEAPQKVHDPNKCDDEFCQRKPFKSQLCATHYAELIGINSGLPDESPGAGGSGEGGEHWFNKKEEHPTWQACMNDEGVEYFYNTETKETSWDKPEELMTEEEKDAAGDWRWIPDSKQCFIPGKVIEQVGLKSKIQLEDGTIKTVKTEDFEPLIKSSLNRVVADLVLLDNMSAPLILYNLKKRFEDNQIYTNIGTILISCNPYQRLPIYGQDTIEKYMRQRVGQDMPPHVFQIAYDSYYRLTQFGFNQSIIISGESGAGKTEATKQCLNFLAVMAGSTDGVEKKVLQANPILEAFGNAKTIRNDNSSRFGKYMEIAFNDKNQICTSVTRNYLLEKIRVCMQGGNERNFHIFYQLSKAAPPQLRAQLQLAEPDEYRFLKTCIDVDTINDEKDFEEVQQAFKDLDFSDHDVNEIFRTVSAVLAIGNIKFETADDKTRATVASPDTQVWMESAASLLQIEIPALLKALTIRELRIRGQNTTEVVMPPKQSGDARDALAKFIYGDMFNWLVGQVNKSFGQTDMSVRNERYIGILDIFGFEIFKHNSFEQLCINFTNEMLQQHFNHHTFRLEEELYKAEKIKFKHVDFIDNQPMLDLITKKPYGVLPLLDEELVVPRGTDMTFLQKLGQHQEANKVFGKNPRVPNIFIISHYAGDVTYDVNGFLEKNRDTLTQDILEALSTSQSSLLQVLFPREEIMDVDNKANKSSLSKQFQRQLTDLMNTLNVTEPHYIRCVKPNETKAAMKFVSKNCLEQLTYSGVFEAVAIRKQGFPFRCTHDEFAERYMCVLGMEEKGEEHDDLLICNSVTRALKFKSSNCQQGLTRILYRADEHKTLELQRSIKIKVINVNIEIRKLLKLSNEDHGDDPEAQEAYFQRLADAIRNADKFKIESSESEQARALLEKYVAERMDPATQTLLDTAQREMRHADVVQVIAICDEKGYRTQQTLDVRSMLEDCQEADFAAQIALADVDPDMLQHAIQMCDMYTYHPDSRASAEALLDKVDRCESMIEQGLEQMNKLKLEKSIEYAETFNYTLGRVEAAKEALERIKLARAELRDAQEAVDLDMLQAATALADSIKYDSELVRECKKLVRLIQRTLKMVDDLTNNVLLRDRVKMCLAAATEINYQPVMERCEVFREQVEDADDALEFAMSNLDMDELEAALALCEAIRYEHDSVEEARDLHARMARLHKQVDDLTNNKLTAKRANATLKAATKLKYPPVINKAQSLLDKLATAENRLALALEEVDKELLSEAIAFSDEIKLDSPALDEARLLLTNIVGLEEEIVAAVENELSPLDLKTCLKYAKELGYAPAVKRCYFLFKKMKAADETMKDAMADSDRASIEEGLAGCREILYNSQYGDEARALLERMDDIDEMCEEARSTLKEEDMEACLVAAGQIGYSTKILVKFKKLLKPSDREALLKYQYKRATKVLDEPRGIRIAVEVKDIEMAADGGKFSISNYAGLKAPDVWVGELGGLFNGALQKKLLGTYMSFQTEALHAPLTRWAPLSTDKEPQARYAKLKQEANFCFEAIQMWMGQHPSGSSDTAVKRVKAAQMIRLAVENKDLRDEIYILIIKQMTQNPQPASVATAWELLTACMCVFPPSPNLESYVEAWIRREPEQVAKYKVSHILRMRCLTGMGSLLDAPGERDVQRQGLGPTIARAQQRIFEVKPNSVYFTPPELRACERCGARAAPKLSICRRHRDVIGLEEDEPDIEHADGDYAEDDDDTDAGANGRDAEYDDDDESASGGEANDVDDMMAMVQDGGDEEDVFKEDW